MFTPDELESIPVKLEQLFNDLQMNVMADVVRRISNMQDISAASDWQINRLYELGMSKSEIQKFVQKTLGKSDKEIDKVFTDIIESGYARNESLYKAVGKDFIPYKDNKSLQQLVKAVNAQTKSEYKNITQSLGFAIKQPDGTLKFQPIAEYYQKTLDDASMQIASGTFDYNTVLNRTVAEITNSGLRSVDYASGWSNRVPVAARRAVMTGFNQVVAKVNEDNAKALDTDYFEVSYHTGARPTHQVWQGRVYSKSELESVCGLGSVTGLCGANCYHSYSPFIKGVSERIYTDEQLDKMNTAENTPTEYNGKSYTTYEATQRQRRLETTMRAQREKIKLLQDGGADEQDILNAKARYFGTSDEYVNFSKTMNLPQQRERVNIDGLGTVKSAKSVAKSADGGILKEGSIFNGESYNPDDINRAISSKSTNFVTRDSTNPEYDYGIAIDCVKPIQGLYDIKAHGDYDGIKLFDTPVGANELARVIISRKDYNGEPIRLLSCNTGKLTNGTCVAKELSEILGVEVIAPNDYLLTDGKGLLRVGRKRFNNTGKFVSYK